MLQFVNGRIYAYDASARRFVAHADLLLDGDVIAALDAGDVTSVERVDLEGRTIVPAFTDCHVHLAEAGYYAGPRSLASVRSYAAFDDAVARIPRDGEIVYAGQFDDALWTDGLRADAAPLERHHPDALAMLVRVDSHSTIVNRATLKRLAIPPDLPGLERDERGEPTGRLFTDANWLAIARFVERIPLAARRASERRGAELALARGVVAVHAQLLGRDADGYAADIEALSALPIAVHPKICEPDASLASRLGLPYVGGDVFLDGSIGSCTAALSAPYAGRESAGALRFADDDLFAYFSGAERAGISAGVHAIGDAAIDQCLRIWSRVLEGRTERRTRHFIEHFEMPSREHIAQCARYGIMLSMQPQFQATWGTGSSMYDERLGEARRKAMNPLRSVLRAGATLCAGSDAPVCALDPIAGMQAAMYGQEPDECLDAHEALAAYTVAAARMGFEEDRAGNLAAGMRAEFVVLDRDPFADGSWNGVRVLQTWRDGARLR